MDGHHAHNEFDPQTVSELEALRGKLSSLQDTFAAQIIQLGEPKHALTWPDLLNKFNMLTAKFTTLSRDFYEYTENASKTTLPKLMLHPYCPTTTEKETTILSVLLRTKLIPDIEMLEEETKKAIAHDLAVDTTLMDDVLVQKQLQEWKKKRTKHDHVANMAADYVVKNAADLMEGKAADFVPDLTAEHRNAFLERLNPEPPAEKQAEWNDLKDATEKGWQGYQLECMVNFCNNGRCMLEGSDLRK